MLPAFHLYGVRCMSVKAHSSTLTSDPILKYPEMCVSASQVFLPSPWLLALISVGFLEQHVLLYPVEFVKWLREAQRLPV